MLLSILIIGFIGFPFILAAVILHFEHKNRVLFETKKDPRKIEKIVVGYIIIAGIASVIVGGPLQLLGAAAVLIICTGGVGLIPVAGAMLICLPIAYGIGSLIFFLFTGKKENTQEEKENVISPLTNNLQAVSNFIKDARRYNFTDQDIFRQLKSVGWEEVDIINGFKFADNVRLT